VDFELQKDSAIPLYIQLNEQVRLHIHRGRLRPNDPMPTVRNLAVQLGINANTVAKVFMHSCGAIYDIIPDLIEVGVDVLNPVQISARNMAPEKLKDEFGKEIAFWGGGIDIQKFPWLSEDEIKEEVKRVLDIWMPGGGYVFAATHNILPETKGEQTYTAYITAVENRDY